MDDLTLNNYLIAFSLTLFAGISTSIGAVLAFFSKEKNYKILSLGLGFSAGVMIYVSFMEILVKSKESFFEIYKSESLAEFLMIVCFFLGILLSAFIDYMIPKDVNPHEPKSSGELNVLKEDVKTSTLKLAHLKRTGIFTALAIGIHNFPEGFATFTASLESFSLGLSIAIAIAIHNIPEGMSISLPIYYATNSKKKAFWYATFSGLAEPIGAVVGFFLLYPFLQDSTLAIIFGIVAGIMIHISFDELLPASRIYGNAHTTILGICLGMLVMSLSLLAFI
ncbi:zinc transporter ZupT [Arcobacter cloacae]|uniref:Zinc transporter ZupT n=1 Tax=Arcobacter cloacae TaxID=1054034 RepID=A0A4Q0ZFS1_9BACT|nr:zinc transporter ZupT [Arcobacter cloacae]RXJ85323.1 zinc transporter ZupT [Arcobacter cloacae]